MPRSGSCRSAASAPTSSSASDVGADETTGNPGSGGDPDAPQPPALAWLTVDGRVRTEELAPIWATVELERALLDLDQPIERAATALEDPLLGARVAVMDLADAEGPERLAIAEPTTEGRLARALAEHGERTVGRYVAVSTSLAVVASLAAAAGVSLTRPEPGPLGAEVLVLGGPPGGPFLLLVESPAVPSPP
jgi:hypothetical protein